MSPFNTTEAQVIIVGAGPVGLMMANLLGSQGLHVILLERNEDTVGEPRAVSLDDESLRTLQSAGLAEAVIAKSVLGYGVQYFSWRGKHFASILPTRQEFGYPKRNAFRQPLLEATLREGLKRFANVQALFGHELVSFENGADRVTCEVRSTAGMQTFTALWMVGCDGGRSAVRDACGIRLEGETYAQRWLIVDLANRTTPLRHTQTFCDPERPAIRLPGPQATLRYEFMLRPGEDDAFALHEPRFREWIATRCAADRDLPLVRKAVYAFHARVATRWRAQRVFLAGDAAHLTPPFAGQGLNSGIRDAANLAWKLAGVLHWGAPEMLLDTYEAERRPHAQALIRMALRIGTFMQPKSRVSAALMQSALRVAFLWPAARDYVLQLKFKPKPRLHAGYFEPGSGNASWSDLLPQPWMETPDRSVQRLDDLMGSGFCVVGWDSPQFRARASTLAPAGVPLTVIALKRAHEDFIDAAGVPGLVQARDGGGELDAFLDSLDAQALVVRPDRYWSHVIRAKDWAPPSTRPKGWPIHLLQSTT